MCFVMKMSWFFQFIFLIKNLKTLWIYCFTDDKSHYVYNQDFNTFMFHKTKTKKIENGFVKVVYSALVMRRC